MKNLILTALLSLLTTHAAAAQDRIGNGGGLWTCNEVNGELRQGQLVDLFEARQEFQLYIPDQGMAQTPQEIFEVIQKRIVEIHPEFAAQLDPFMKRVTSNIMMVDAVLALVDDSLWRIQPLAVDCLNGNWEYTQFANFTNYDRVLIRRDLWNSAKIPSLDKAALLFHEGIYLMLRETASDSDSVRARRITGLIFSNLPKDEIAKQINLVLASQPPTTQPQPPPSQWVCVVENPYEHLTYLGYGTIELEARFIAEEKCQKGAYKAHCKVAEAKCAPIQSVEEKYACINFNEYSDQSYFGKGRNVIEAAAKATQACQSKDYKQHCKIRQCSPSN